MNTSGQGNDSPAKPIPGFRLLAAKSRPRALEALNDPNLTFPTLYLHAADIRRFDLYDGLTVRNLVGLRLITRKQHEDALAGRIDQMLPTEGDEIRDALIWIIQTGASWDGPHPRYDAYDAAIDAAAARLIRDYDDTSTLPIITDLIFRRNRQGLLIHDLVWSFFQSAKPDAMALVAEYLLSSEPEDFVLSCKLLHLPLPGGDVGPGQRRRMFDAFLNWLRENEPYLYFTGENFQETSAPTPIKLSNEAKYLGKRISPATKRFEEGLTEEQKMRLQEFAGFSAKEQENLSYYSHGLRKADPNAWQLWMDQSPGIQVAAIRATGGMMG